MSRGGRGGGRGGKRGPDLSWQDEDPAEAVAPQRNIPRPQFPERHLTAPKPLTQDEKVSVKSLLHIRERIRSGPLYTILEPSTLLDEKGKANPRAGFDPFNDQERFTKRYHRKRRIIPDLSERNGYTLRLFPLELWPILDPKHRQKEYWDILPEDLKARLVTGGNQRPKRKRTDKLRFDEPENDHKNNSSSDDEDATLSASKRRKLTAAKTRKEDQTTKQAKQKKGLDAEDDYGETEPQDDNAEGAEGGEEEPQDSEYETEEEDDGGDDYNAEQYFDDGEGDDFADGDDDPGEREFYS